MKKRTKKLISMSLASIMALSLAGCGGSSGGSDSSKKEGSGDAGKTLNIWCWNDEFQSRFNDYYPASRRSPTTSPPQRWITASP